MNRPRERLEGRVDGSQMDFLYWYAERHTISRNEALRIALDDNPEYAELQLQVVAGTDIGRQYLKEATVARRKLAHK